MGKVIGWVLFFGFFVFGMMGLSASNAYRPEISHYFYFGAAFSCLVFGSICYELGNCSEYLEKILKNHVVTSSSKAQEIKQESPEADSTDKGDSIICKQCNHIIPTGAARCPHCKWIC